MTGATSPRPPLYSLAWAVLTIGLIGLLLVLSFGAPPFLENPLMYIFLAFFGGGGGEIINHPKKKIFSDEQTTTDLPPSYHRMRNPCGLGNLLEISSIIIFFVGLGKFLAG